MSIKMKSLVVFVLLSISVVASAMPAFAIHNRLRQTPECQVQNPPEWCYI